MSEIRVPDKVEISITCEGFEVRVLDAKGEIIASRRHIMDTHYSATGEKSGDILEDLKAFYAEETAQWDGDLEFHETTLGEFATAVDDVSFETGFDVAINLVKVAQEYGTERKAAWMESEESR